MHTESYSLIRHSRASGNLRVVEEMRSRAGALPFTLTWDESSQKCLPVLDGRRLCLDRLSRGGRQLTGYARVRDPLPGSATEPSANLAPVLLAAQGWKAETVSGGGG